MATLDVVEFKGGQNLGECGVVPMAGVEQRPDVMSRWASLAPEEVLVAEHELGTDANDALPVRKRAEGWASEGSQPSMWSASVHFCPRNLHLVLEPNHSTM